MNTIMQAILIIICIAVYMMYSTYRKNPEKLKNIIKHEEVIMKKHGKW